MLSGSVTSSASTRRCSERGSTSPRGLRIVATIFQSRSRKYRAISRPNPDEHPVIRMVFMWALLSGVRSRSFDLLSAPSCGVNLAQTEPHSEPPPHPVRFDVLEVLTVHTRRALVGAALSISVRQNVLAADLVVEGVEAVAGFCLRFRVQRRLQFLNALRS